MTRTNHMDAAYKRYFAENEHGIFSAWELYLKASGYADAVMEHNAAALADKQRDTPVSSGLINPLYHGFVSIDAGYMKQEAAPDAQEGGKEAQTDRRCRTCRHTIKKATEEPCSSCSCFTYQNWQPK